jgi:membrane associated rhomboid family serine protease
MVMPLWDHNPFKWPTPPYVMWAIVIVNFAVFFAQVVFWPDQMDQFDKMAGLVPAALTGSGGVPGGLPAPLTLITSMFLHANFMHVFGNMIFLFVFGDDIEEALGHWRFLVFYLACGLGAALAFILSDPGSDVDLIGASGAVAGVISAYLLYRPCFKVTCLLGLIPLRLRAFWIIGFWAIWQVVEIANQESDGVAYWAHIGGLITGAVLFMAMRPAGIKLLQCVDEAAVEAGTAS